MGSPIIGGSGGSEPKNPVVDASNHPPVYAISLDPGAAALVGQGSSAGLFIGDVAVQGKLTAKGLATQDLTVSGSVIGTLRVTGDIHLYNGADLAEEFDCADPVAPAPGSVMVLADDGSVQASSRPYDRRVVGIVPGAGALKPAIVLGEPGDHSVRVAMVGKVYVQADAGPAPIRAGDLLTTSSTVGHAMRAGDSARAFGAVIGKSLGPLSHGTGLVPALVALQ